MHLSLSVSSSFFWLALFTMGSPIQLMSEKVKSLLETLGQKLQWRISRAVAVFP